MIGSVTFEKKVKIGDTDANLFLNISSQLSSWCAETKEKIGQENNAETYEATEDSARISGHPVLVATDNDEEIEAHPGQHFGQQNSADSDQPDSELQFDTESEADAEILASLVLRRSSMD